ncbi:MAG: hypothetical protein C4521_06905 [Actinobacteria bacterium]|nr:MAG: hypothetical protein C4521_06905 [Actinomycetota bacterium]
MFKSPRLFFIYLAWFVGLTLVIYGVFNLALGGLYAAVPDTARTVSYGLFGSGPDEAFLEEEMMGREMVYEFMPPRFQTLADSEQGLSKLSKVEKKEYDEAYRAAEKKAKQASVKRALRQKELDRARSLVTAIKGLLGLLLGIPLVAFTWRAGTREPPEA